MRTDEQNEFSHPGCLQYVQTYACRVDHHNATAKGARTTLGGRIPELQRCTSCTSTINSIRYIIKALNMESGTNFLSDLGGKCRHTTVKSSKYNINHRKNLMNKKFLKATYHSMRGSLQFHTMVLAADFTTSSLNTE